MHEINWSGFAHIDLRSNHEDYKIIEINPRVWNTIEASKKVGVNFPYLYCLSSLGISYEVPEYRFEKFADNTGLIKVLKSKIGKHKIRYNFPENTVLKSFFLDPLPGFYKFCVKWLQKILPRNTKFIKKFKYDVY